MGRRGRGRGRPVRQTRWRRAGRPGFGRRRDGVEGRRGGGGGGLLALILVIAIGVGVWYFLIRDDDGSDVTPVSPTPTVSVTSSPEAET